MTQNGGALPICLVGPEESNTSAVAILVWSHPACSHQLPASKKSHQQIPITAELLTVNTAKRRFLLRTLTFLYLGLMVVCFGLSTVLLVSHGHSGDSIGSFFAIRVKLVNFVVFGFVLLAWHSVFFRCGFYESQRLTTRMAMAIDTVKATTWSTIVLAAIGKLFLIKMVTPGFILVFWLLSSTVVVAARLAARYTLGRLRLHGRNLRHVLILGTNGRAVEFARKIEGNPELGYRILGFVDEDWSGRQDFLKTGYGLCCDFDGLPEFLRRNVIDEVAMYLPVRSFYEFTSQVAALCELHGIKMRFATDIFNFKIALAYADDIGGGAHITAHSGSPDSFGLFLKRVLDVLVSFGLLVCLAPLLAITALLVKLTSEGPILYMQERVGLGKRRFRIFKFRTMVHLAHRAHHAVTTADNQRFTPIGRFLRRWKLDEVPQLLNVLLGDMSLVGPRPRMPEHVISRLSCRPGITGWATMVFANEENVLARVPADQLNAFYRGTVLPMKRQLDTQYMARATFLSDLQLLVKSVLRRWDNAALEAVIFTPAGPRAKATFQEFGKDTAFQAVCADELAQPEQVSA